MLKLHFAPNSRAGRIVWLLEELELPYDINKMAFHPQDLKSDEHRARHPLGRVPVLDDGDITIFESGAIVEYVIARHKNGGLKPSENSPLFPEYLQWFHYCEGMVMPPINTIVVQTVLLPPDRRDEKALSQAQRLLTKALEPVNEALAGRDYLIGVFSAADIMLGHACFMGNRLGCVGEEMPHLKAYVERVANRPAFKTAIEMQ
ncbi:MAG: glutathione S-transferase family protein [Gammaproteobacteria bacterium]|jgi:glutathione S-transferase|nr:glutathione S-transferase family protein [Gammaproteobacteria bacterium]MBT3694201.1 glutathione S-transferase family protein [Gammaproteobacteria bacterium]MBT5682353.1 glutathione S-transferase family protein [Gammaproteobacteria bacterium]MBT6025972.1 glutathione S-transferase family protein [Gammaproteobacteria bacterium]MBT6558433.1 glutathione S-transferase family protein [Gammaproteobacteria bacterium]